MNLNRTQKLTLTGNTANAGIASRRYLLVGITLLIIALALSACGGSETEPAPTPTTAPTLSPGRTPVATAPADVAPADPLAITRDDLPGMVLGQSAIAEIFPGLTLNTAASGYRDNETTAAASINSTDTSAGLAAQGRLDGYTFEFSDPGAFSAGATNRPVSATISVVLFVTPPLAQTSLIKEFSEIEEFSQNEIAGITLKNFDKLAAPDVGADALSGRLTISIASLGIDTTSTFVSWRRGPIVATVGITYLGDTDAYDDEVRRLATLVDERIDGVLSGDIIVVAPLIQSTEAPGPTSTPEPTPVPLRTAGLLEETATLAGFDLDAMLPTAADLPAEAAINQEGFLDQPGTLSSYKREFISAGDSISFGNSQIANIGTSVLLHESSANAGAQITLLDALGPEPFGEALATGFAGSRGANAEDLVFSTLELPQVGDERTGFLTEFTISGEAFQGYFLIFSQGQVLGQLLVIGPDVALADTMSLAQVIETKISANSP